ncbi:Hypothetical_protein [Hexamita inflata]|uniref:Hypothetical_protein n=1 Tax=Hexamita inflata TaxID=28002 RepID=A0ABP1HZD2_9EUKA
MLPQAKSSFYHDKSWICDNGYAPGNNSVYKRLNTACCDQPRVQPIRRTGQFELCPVVNVPRSTSKLENNIYMPLNSNNIVLETLKHKKAPLPSPSPLLPLEQLKQQSSVTCAQLRFAIETKNEIEKLKLIEETKISDLKQNWQHLSRTFRSQNAKQRFAKKVQLDI